jgi:hypothetical protein
MAAEQNPIVIQTELPFDADDDKLVQGLAGLVISDHYCSGDNGYVGFDFAIHSKRNGKLVISNQQNCCESWRTYIRFEGVYYNTAKQLPSRVAYRISQLIITNIISEKTRGNYDKRDQRMYDKETTNIIMTFVAYEPNKTKTNNRVHVPISVYLIVSNCHNGYYPHEAIAFYNGTTNSFRI